VSVSDLTDDEYTVLAIAAQGQYMAPIGRWEQPVYALARRGLLFKHDAVNYTITSLGKTALANREQDDDRALGMALQKVARAPQVQSTTQDFAEQAAHHLVDAAKASAVVTGDTPEAAAEKWGALIVKRAKDLLRGQ
jgi:hypothetical protein